VTLPLSYSRPQNQLSALSCQLSVKASAAKAASILLLAAWLKPCPFTNLNYPEIMEPMIRIELMTSPLPRECSTN
jgi:hypothetical protein